MWILTISSLVLATLAGGCAIYATFELRRERSARERLFEAVAIELERLRKDVQALRPAVRFSSPDGRRSLRRDRAADEPILGPLLIAVPDLTAPTLESPIIPPEYTDRFGGIWELADAGASAESIARATGQPIGRIELILALRFRDELPG